MKIEQLQKFCAKSDIRYYLLKPWINSGHAFASNGHIAVRVPSDGLFSVVAHGEGQEPNVGALVDNAKALGLPLMAIPELAPPEVCEACAGTGTAYECEECEGEGSFTHHGKEYDCKWCNGLGQHQNGQGDPETCFHCDGFGEKAYRPVAVGDSHFDRRYLALIAALPNAMIAPNGPAGVAYFTFDGGDGALMPMRVDHPAVEVPEHAEPASAAFPCGSLGEEVPA